MPDTPTVQFAAASSSAAEADGTLAIAVSLSTTASTTDAVTVPITVAGTGTAVSPDDYEADVTEVTFPAGSNDGDEQTVTLTLVNDALVEGDETVDLQLGTPTGADLGMTTDHNATITDSDTATVELEMTTANTAEISGAAMVNVVLTTGGPSGAATLASAMTVDIADAGTGDATVDTDYAMFAGLTLTFDVGATDQDSQAAAIDIIADLDSEPDETVDLALSNPSAPLALGTNALASLVIVDDDQLITGNGFNVFTVDRVDPSSTLTAGSSYGFSGTEDAEGAAWDPINNVLYLASETSEDALMMYDPATQKTTLVGQFSIPGISPTIESLAFDPNTNVLYAVDDNTNTLISVDPATGLGTVVGTQGALGTSQIEALAFDPNANVLYGVDDGSNELLTLDTTNGTSTVVGSVGTSAIEGLTFDATNNILYGIDDTSGAGELVTINTTTAAVTVVAAINGTFSTTWDHQGLAFDSVNGVMYASEIQFEQVWTIDTTTAAVTFSGMTGFKGFDGFTFDPANNRMLAVLEGDDVLVEVNLTTGEPLLLTHIDQAITPSINAMAYDATNSLLYIETNADLYTLDMATGAATLIGDLQVGTSNRFLTAMAFDGTGTLWAMDSDELFTVNTATGALTLIGDTNLTSFDGLAWDTTNNVLYASRLTNDLYTLNTTDATPTHIGNPAVDNWEGLSIDPATGLLWTWDISRDVLVSIVPTTLVVTTVGGVGVNADAMAFDPNTGTYYASDFAEDHLFTIDFVNNTATSIGPFGDSVHGMAFDPTNNLLWGTTGSDELVTISTTDGSLTVLGTTAPNVEALAFDSVNGVLYGTDNNTLFTISTADGTATTVGAHGGNFTDVHGLGFDPAHGVLYGSDVNERAILLIDVTTGAATQLRRSRNSAPFGMTFARL